MLGATPIGKLFNAKARHTLTLRIEGSRLQLHECTRRFGRKPPGEPMAATDWKDCLRAHAERIFEAFHEVAALQRVRIDREFYIPLLKFLDGELKGRVDILIDHPQTQLLSERRQGYVDILRFDLKDLCREMSRRATVRHLEAELAVEGGASEPPKIPQDEKVTTANKARFSSSHGEPSTARRKEIVREHMKRPRDFRDCKKLRRLFSALDEEHVSLPKPKKPTADTAVRYSELRETGKRRENVIAVLTRDLYGRGTRKKGHN